MSHVKSSGSVAQHAQGKRKGKRLGVKKFGGETIMPGQIILRQRGAKYKAGAGTGMGRDHTIFAMLKGSVVYGQRFGRTLVKVLAN